MRAGVWHYDGVTALRRRVELVAEVPEVDLPSLVAIKRQSGSLLGGNH